MSRRARPRSRGPATRASGSRIGIEQFKRRLELSGHLHCRLSPLDELMAFFERRTTAAEMEWMVSVDRRIVEEYARRSARRRAAAQMVAGVAVALMTGLATVAVQRGDALWFAPCVPLLGILVLCLVAVGRTPNVPVAPFSTEMGTFKETFRGEARLLGQLRLLEFERHWQELDLYRVSMHLAASLMLFSVFLFLAFPLVAGVPQDAISSHKSGLAPSHQGTGGHGSTLPAHRSVTPQRPAF